MSVETATKAYMSRFSQTPELERIWNEAAQNLEPTPGGFAKSRENFWDIVNNSDSEDAQYVRQVLESAGFEIQEGKSTAAMLRIVHGTKETDMRLTIDHILPKKLHPDLTLDPKNLVFMIQRDNSTKGTKLVQNHQNKFYHP